MKIGIYSPYLPDHFGGGEKYILDVARILAEQHQVVMGVSADRVPPEAKVSPASQKLYWQTVSNHYSQFLGADLSSVSWQITPLGSSESFWKKLWWTKQFDLMYAVTDGSIFASLAQRNILHIQIPFTQGPQTRFGRWKLGQWSVINTNSQFTKKVIEQHWGVKVSAVHTPMVQPPADHAQLLAETAKEKVILSVGRFFKQLHSKKQEVLVKAFKQLCDQDPEVKKSWQLVLIGSVEDQTYVDEVKALVADYPIKLLHQVTRSELWQWYRRASVYWHAAGFEVDENLSPEKVEHFGISTVEAMASGCVPIVVGKGGQPEVLGAELSALLWQSVPECVAITHQLIQDTKARLQLAQLAQKRAAVFSEEQFRATLNMMVAGSGLDQSATSANVSFPAAPITPAIPIATSTSITPATPVLQTTPVTVIIPTFNGRQLLAKHLPAVWSCLRSGDQVIIADDASQDDTIEWLRHQFPALRLRSTHISEVGAILESEVTVGTPAKKITLTVVAHQHNQRFATNCNSAVAEAKHNYILLLNNDVAPAPDVLSHLMPHFQDSAVFAVGCHEWEGDRQGGRNTLKFEQGLFVHQRAQDFTTGPTAWVSGGSGLFDRSKWLELGGFDLSFYPAYWEDVDLSFRARQRGWKVLFEAKARVEHHHESTNSDVFGAAQIKQLSWRQSLLFTWKRGSWWQRLEFLCWWPVNWWRFRQWLTT